MLAEQAEIIERGGAAIFDAQAFGQQQEPAVIGDGGQLVAPDFAVEHDGDEITELGVDAMAGEKRIGMPAQFLERQRGHGSDGIDVCPAQQPDPLPLGARRRDVILGLAHALRRHKAGKGQKGDGHSSLLGEEMTGKC